MDHQVQSCSERIVIHRKNSCLQVWNILDLTIQLITSYYYGFICAFGFEVFGKAGIYLDYSITCFFTISIILEFLTEVKIKGGERPIRTLQGIGYHYITNGKFFFDLIQVIPYPFFFDFDLMEDSDLKYLYFIRLYRLVRGLSVMNISNMMYYIKKYYKH